MSTCRQRQQPNPNYKDEVNRMWNELRTPILSLKTGLWSSAVFPDKPACPKPVQHLSTRSYTPNRMVVSRRTGCSRCFIQSLSRPRIRVPELSQQFMLMRLLYRDPRGNSREPGGGGIQRCSVDVHLNLNAHRE
jgi:hypothetical protein